MLTTRFVVILSLLVGCGSSAPPPTTPPAPADPVAGPPEKPPAKGVKQYDAATLFKNVAIDIGGFSHDGSKVLVATNATGIFNLYAYPTAGGEPTRLTTSTTESQFAVSYFPADDRILYSQDAGGNELDHLYVLDGANTKDLTPGAKLKASFAGWSADGASFWVTTNERDPKAFDLYRYNTKDYKRELVFTNKAAWAIGDVSRDGRWLALGKPRTNADSDVFLLDLKKKGAAPKLITAHKGDVQNNVIGFAPDSKTLWFNTDGHGEFVQAWSYDLATAKSKAEVTAEWDVRYVAFSEKGRYRVSATNEDAKSVLRVVDTTTGQEVARPAIPNADVTLAFFSKDETKMGMALSSDRTPSDLWVTDVGGEPRQLTRTLNSAIDPNDLVDGEVVRYPSFDKLPIPSILYKPKDASPTAKVPALVWVHGGPGGQSRRGYSSGIQHLVNHGYAVLAVNNRGSSGYGKTFFHLDDKKHGDVDLKDCVAARAYLASLPWVDGARVGIMGGSYGGYMVGAALAFAPEAFEVGIDIFGVMNWVRTLESIPPWWASFRDSLYAEMGDPAKESERLKAISPLFHAANIKKPLLVVQGANDPRVLKVESDEIVAAVKKNNVPVEYLVFLDEGHGFVKQDNNIKAQEAYLRFLDRHLRDRK